ncbi:hypothetical protein PS862_02464 [Pseudomonas fluorescens]|uniref:Uncharacterized protein n=1 Tax=Pseudomonas fluorescens TaxID=294 RepID=A0A5E7JWU1_PSEFL|nr:hypothetical protein PS639_05232 [Pseudomonas fluorescens]VVO93518.1 hypothetical protein PS862_02464 [Pseudomonas fluorescens]
MHQSIRSDKWILTQYQFTDIRHDRGPARSRELFQLMERLQNRRNDLCRSLSTHNTLVVLVNGLEVAFSFFSQYYTRHVLPT